MKRFLTIWNLCLGAMDSSTGLCLIAAPAWTLGMMGVGRPPTELHLVSYIGVFVLAIGLAYFLAIRPPHDSEAQGRWSAVWKITALARFLVAVFVVWKVTSGILESAWLTVAITDASAALIQTVGLGRGWLKASCKI